MVPRDRVGALHTPPLNRRVSVLPPLALTHGVVLASAPSRSRRLRRPLPPTRDVSFWDRGLVGLANGRGQQRRLGVALRFSGLRTGSVARRLLGSGRRLRRWG
jgi:hypothetical protein